VFFPRLSYFRHFIGYVASNGRIVMDDRDGSERKWPQSDMR
jgi:hypothetical protein